MLQLNQVFLRWQMSPLRKLLSSSQKSLSKNSLVVKSSKPPKLLSPLRLWVVLE